jgi:hypothetical protein
MSTKLTVPSNVKVTFLKIKTSSETWNHTEIKKKTKDVWLLQIPPAASKNNVNPSLGCFH